MHRDIKSSNIGFDMEGDVKIFDFGFAKSFVSDVCDLKGGGGSQGYMAPEMETERKYGIKADVFSFGVVLWEILAMTARANAKVENSVDLPICTTWPTSLQELLRGLLSAEPCSRPTMKEAR